jgi:glycosyltransferase involved in cell wall biosynthesis
MDNHYTFTYIIPYKHGMDRINNLLKTINWLLTFDGIEIIVVEQDKVQKLNTLPIRGVKHIFTPTNLPFNRSWGHNVGLKHASTDIIVFGDGDLIMDTQEFALAIKELERYDAVSPYKRVIDLEYHESGQDINYWKNINRPGRGETDNQKINIAGGILAMRREACFRIGGFSSEQFIGWGAEDNFMSHKIMKYLTWKECEYKCYHLWHPRVVPDMKYYQRNLELLNRLVVLNDSELKNYIRHEGGKLGLKNKFIDAL